MDQPYSIDELLVATFAQHDGEMRVANDGLSLLGMSIEGNLIKIDVPDGKNFNDMTDEEINQTIIEILK